jgi:antitoxin HicB
MTKKKHPNVGSSLEDFLHEEGLTDSATAIAVKRVIAWQLQKAMTKHGLTKTAMAARMATTRAQLDRVLNPQDGNVTIETLQRAASAVGKKLRLELA